jgi:hypothetical protein
MSIARKHADKKRVEERWKIQLLAMVQIVLMPL